MDFSVLISLYYKESPKYLDLALKSVFNQSLMPDQVVLVLDGSIGSELQAIVNKYKQQYPALDVFPQAMNMGLSTALNVGLEKCRNDIVFRMDTDDVCYPNRFERVLQEYEENPELEIVGSFSTMIDEDGDEIKSMSAPTSQEEIYRNVWTCPFIHPTVSFKKSAILRVGSYNPNSGPRQDDYELWFRCVANKLKCKNISEPLLYYRFFKNSVAKNNIEVGWWRTKVGLKGAWMCNCSPIAYIGVCYPLFRACMPGFIRELMYKVSDKINPRIQK
jgi:glycosyltransferase involved in cell wall biosynthesis